MFVSQVPAEFHWADLWAVDRRVLRLIRQVICAVLCTRPSFAQPEVRIGALASARTARTVVMPGDQFGLK